jgi:hypothetical protein
MLTHTCLMHEHEIDGDVVERFFRRLTKRVGEIRCGLTGHTVMLRYEPARLSLQCTSCGYESPGWELAPARQGRSSRPARLLTPIPA